MKKKIFLRTLGFTLMAAIFVACEKDDEKSDAKDEFPYSTLIVNQGNYSEANGSLSIIDNDGNITNQVYKTANGYALGSIIESAVDCSDKGYWALMCNNEDKVEFVDKKTFQSVLTVKDISIPRYGAYVNSTLYVTSGDYNATENVLFAIDVKTGEKDTVAVVEGVPEGIVYNGSKLWMAASKYDNSTWSYYDPAVYCINPSKKTIEYVCQLSGEFLGAKHLTVDKSDNVWVSMTGYGVTGAIAKVDTVSSSLTDRIDLEQLNFPGHIYASADGGSIFYMTSDGYSSGSTDETTEVRKVDLSSKSVKTVVKGNGFYGFSVLTGDDIYTANVSGFMTNSILKIYDNAGNQTNADDVLVGVGACRFMRASW